ncbi:MAG TPA: alcohol dehydrogenase catalytic domain-containing protein [Longimicrobiales bacterium]|nr:alcohol dehydrogenase catalytic domain-containing protein [Longimicrobiales bacterium]
MPTPGPGEILMRVTACGLCGSDALDWYVARKAPVVLGHEPVGRVVAVGPGVTTLQPGQRVFAHHHAPCMACPECERRLWSNCATWRASALDPGGFAEYARVPAASVAHDVLVLPDDVSDEAATFVEPAACCLRALDKARPRPGDAVLVMGLGPMGLLLAQLAGLRDGVAVFGTDLRPDRRAGARAMGLDVLNGRRGLAGEIRARTGGRGADVVIVTPGTATAVRAGLEAAAPGARVVCFTPLDPADPLALDQAALYFREIELLQSYSCGPDETRAALDIIHARQIALDSLVSHRVGLEGVADALRRAHSAEGLKTIVFP